MWLGQSRLAFVAAPPSPTKPPAVVLTTWAAKLETSRIDSTLGRTVRQAKFKSTRIEILQKARDRHKGRAAPRPTGFDPNAQTPERCRRGPLIVGCRAHFRRGSASPQFLLRRYAWNVPSEVAYRPTMSPLGLIPFA